MSVDVVGNGLSPRDFELAALKSVLTPALPHIEACLQELEEGALRRAFVKLSAGSLTPGEAMLILQEVKSYRDLARRMQKRVSQEVEEHHA